MAIQVKASNLNGVAALKKLGLEPGFCDSLQPQGIAVKLTAKTFSFTKADGSAGTEVGVTLDQLQKLSAGTLPMGEKLKLKTQVSDAIASLGAEIGKGVPSPLSGLPSTAAVNVDMPKPASEALVAALKKSAQSGAGFSIGAQKLQEAAKKASSTTPNKKSAPGGVETLKVEPTSESAWAKFPKAKLFSAGMIKLRDATQMYQPVFGTSSGSRYFMVAANTDLKVAARLDAGTLSVRIEGPNWAKHASEIAECGFSNIDKSKGYASMHLHVGEDKKMASKTLGAILTGLGVTLETPVPELKFIYG